MKISDALIGVFLVALAIAILIHIQSCPLIPGQNYGPPWFPGVIAVGRVGCGVWLFVRGGRARQPLIAFSDWMRNPVTVTNFLAVCLVLLFYILVADSLGFL